MSATPKPDKDDLVEEHEATAPWSVFSINGLLMVAALVILALLVWYTIWPHPQARP